MSTQRKRRLNIRDLPIMKQIADRLQEHNISPNQISLASIGASALGAICLLLLPYSAGVFSWILPLLAVIFIQIRMLCNILDGMIAIERNQKTPAGELFNDLPNRISDPLLIVAAGYGAGTVLLGWCAGLLAVLTAYVRTLAISVGAPSNTCGPMAKKHRMIVLSIACLLIMFFDTDYSKILHIALWVIVFGCFATLYRRIMDAYHALEALAKHEN
jgi:phosphatidylglycerophosphate synthase